MIPYGKQDINQDDVDFVVAVLKSDFITQGPMVPEFEQSICKYSGTAYGVAVNSATSALHIACLALGLGQGDWLWTSPNTFVASANCGLYCGAQVDFVDIDPKTYNLCPDRLEEKLIQAQKNGTLPKVVIPVHFAGQSCNMRRIHGLGQQYGFKIIEDASHAIGGKYFKQPIGSCLYSDIAVFSFHPVKIITTGEGGMATTNDINLCEKMQRLRSHGITRNPEQMTEKSHGGWYYQQIELGYNFRMTDIQAALGVSQMKRLDAFVSKRHALAERYNELLDGLPLVIPYQDPDTYSALHLYPIQLELSGLKQLKEEFFDTLRRSDIGVNLHYIPVHMQPYYQRLGFRFGDFPEAERYYSRAITIPMFAGLSEQQQDQVVAQLQKIL